MCKLGFGGPKARTEEAQVALGTRNVGAKVRGRALGACQKKALREDDSEMFVKFVYNSLDARPLSKKSKTK